MLRSMTGFGSATGAVRGSEFEVEVRSVNHRHLIVKTRLPFDDATLEGEVEALVRKHLARGSVSVTLRLAAAAETPPARIDAAAAQRYCEELGALAASIGAEPEVSLDTLLTLPGVVSVAPEDTPDGPALRRAVFAAVGEALGNLVEMRTTEGGALAEDLARHAKSLRGTLDKVERRMPRVVRGHQRQLKERVGELLGEGNSLSPADLAREIAVLADRMDVSEEVSRLASHLDQLDAMLKKGGRVGRKLDFLVQEFLREVNTIGSKCNDAKVSHWVVDMKTHVERLREQVQNVE